jgi:quercetin dioxygenase-like cupin family protein
MDLSKNVLDHAEFRPDKLFKTTLFQSQAMMVGLNCLEPGQIQKAHQHADQDKFYFVLKGTGRFLLGAEQLAGSEGDIIWAPADLEHGVENNGNRQLVLLVGIAPAP